MIIGALEAGGTKMVCAIGDERGNIIERAQFPTMAPHITIPQLLDFFRDKGIDALGIGCFGPIDPDRKSDTYGYITSTPKLAWRSFNIVNAFSDALKVPIGFDTDVNGAALGETAWGALYGCDVGLYITIGTGVGVGVCIDGKPLHGLMHSEAGHILINRHIKDDYEGNCPYHKNCLEGLASGPAIEGRYGKKAYDLKNESEVWELEAYYIAQAIANYTLCYSPNRIVLGGGVMHQEQLFPLIRAGVKETLNGYVNCKEIVEDIDNYIVPPALGDNAGIMGALRLGHLAVLEQG